MPLTMRKVAFRRSAYGFGAVLAITIWGCKATETEPTPPEATNVITITANGVSPQAIVVPPGTQVTFTNNDTRTHDMESDPHPEHNDCPALAQVGFLRVGESRVSGNLITVRTCGYHDNLHEEDPKLRGTITIQ
jgi:plastocyanin